MTSEEKRHTRSKQMGREQLLLKAAEFSAAHHLGVPRVAYPATVARSNGLYALLATLLIGGLIWYSVRTGQQIWLLAACGVLLLVGGLLASSLVVRHASLVLCTHGLLRLAGQHTDGIRWEETREVWQDQHGFLTLTRWRGTPVVINATFRAWDQLAATVAQELLRVRLLVLVEPGHRLEHTAEERALLPISPRVQAILHSRHKNTDASTVSDQERFSPSFANRHGQGVTR